MSGVFHFLDQYECVSKSAVGGRPDLVQAFCDCWQVPFQAAFPLVASTPMLFLAVIGLLLYHWRVNFQKFSWGRRVFRKLGHPSQNLRMLWLDILILNLYYNEDIAGNFQFTSTVLAIVFDSVFLGLVMSAIAKRLSEGNTQHAQEEGPSAEEEEEDVDMSVLKLPYDPFDTDMPQPVNASEAKGAMADSMYQDLTREFSKVLGLFIMQVGLFTLFAKNMNAYDADSKVRGNVNFFYWCLAVMIQVYASNGQLGRTYHREWWDAVQKIDEYSPINPRRVGAGESWWDTLTTCFDAPRLPAQLGREKHRVFGISVHYSLDWKMRRGMDWFVNSVIRETLKFTSPILVNSEEPLDFVKDCMAIFFLTCLDDLTDMFALSIFELRALVKYKIVHRSKCRDLVRNIQKEIFESHTTNEQESDITEKFIQDVQLTEDEERAVREGLKKSEKAAWIRVKKDDFHNRFFQHLLEDTERSAMKFVRDGL